MSSAEEKAALVLTVQDVCVVLDALRGSLCIEGAAEVFMFTAFARKRTLNKILAWSNTSPANVLGGSNEDPAAGNTR